MPTEWLFHGFGTGLGALAVLRACAAGESDGADDAAAHHERYAALDWDCISQAHDAQSFSATRQDVLKNFGRPLKQRCGARFIQCDIGAAILRVVHLLEINEDAP